MCPGHDEGKAMGRLHVAAQVGITWSDKTLPAPAYHRSPHRRDPDAAPDVKPAGYLPAIFGNGISPETIVSQSPEMPLAGKFSATLRVFGPAKRPAGRSAERQKAPLRPLPGSPAA